MAKYIMALDAGTTSNRCILFNEHGEMCSVSQRDITTKSPVRARFRTVISLLWTLAHA